MAGIAGCGHHLVLLAAVAVGGAEPARSATRKLASAEVEVTHIKLGAIRPGVNVFEMQVRNRTGEPLRLGVDLRAEPALWYRNWQSQFPLLLPGRGVRRFEVHYEWVGIGPAARLRLRLAKATAKEDGSLQMASPMLEKWFEVGAGNPAAVQPRLRTEHFDIYVEKGSLAESEIGAIAHQREAALGQLEALLGVTVRDRQGLVFYSSATDKTRETGHTGAGLARNGFIVELYNSETRLNPVHELAHVVGQRLGDPPAFLNEGFAVYASERLGSPALDELGHRRRTIDQAVCELSRAGRLMPLEQLFDFTEIGSDRSQPRIAYPQSASVVKYVVNTAGVDRFREAYARLRSSDDPREHERNRDIFTRIFGRPLDALEHEWQQAMSCSGSE